MAKELDLSHKDHFTGSHRGITFKISRHNNYTYRADESRWSHSTRCNYIYLRKDNFRPDDLAKVFEVEPKFYDTSNNAKQVVRHSDLLESCDFHGGITWFTAKCDPAAPEQILLEVGCDYAHLLDMACGYNYDLEDILRDVKRTIDKLHETLPVLVCMEQH